ncbi:PKD domain-containing protein [Nostoc sp. CHAB 5836]|uniref:PKD domain-containing protein n=1 Tax=Nostoc sp. CHAB 5836 TaxID=2780404 RepID=UPI0034D97DBE|nr:PKD domain-containing protein [Nostoc sp. CHAB 5836]
MNNTLAPGVRKLPSLLNQQIINAIRGINTSVPQRPTNPSPQPFFLPVTPTNYQPTYTQPITPITRTSPAPLTAILLADITNGNFTETDTTKPEYGWTTRGAATILNSAAVLTEDSPFNSNFTQTFIIPSHAKYLQFTLKNTTLGANTPTAPGDAFEVALLNPNTKQSLINTVTGLTQTDSLLNIQNDGTYYTSNKVTLVNTTPNSTLTLNQPLTFKVDLTGIQAGTTATLYFDLLGFGAKDAKVVLDNVILLDNDFIAPVANNDRATTNQTQPVTINILRNDTDADSSINPTTLTIQTNPSNGAIAIKGDGTVTYTPNPTFVGTDTFTYTITDTDGLTSNTATVNITVNNIAPVITVITGDTTTTEGTTANFSATAVDPGDQLTYLWNFGDNSQLVEGQNATHTYADNGTYIATLTVMDSLRVSSFQTLSITVNNVAPTVRAGTDFTANEGQTVTFNGTYTDPGILDTHTYTWDFGDGNTINGTLTPTHIYANNGTYTAKLTITDFDGSVSNDTLTVTVNNVAPVINTINSDITINEGAIANFNAIATDQGFDNLTYNWDFGDGTGPLVGQSVSHIFADNDDYTVSLTVRDSDGAVTIQTLNVKVNNVAPTVSAGTDSIANEGQTITFNGSFTDPGILDTHTIEWNFGDGNTATGIVNPTHTYTQNGTYSVTLTVRDNAGASTIDTLTVTVNNVAPIITQLTGTTEVAEGTPAYFTAAATDAGKDTLTYTWDFGDGSSPVQGFDVSHIFKDNGNYTVTLTVGDTDGATTTQTLITKVNNVAATVDAGVDQIMYTNEPVIFDGKFTDPGILDTHNITWDFGDGASIAGVLNPSHTYAQDGQYIVSLKIQDSDGAISNDTLTLSVKKPPTMSVSDISIVEGDNGNKYAVFTASLNQASLRIVTANYSTTDGTATSSSDYTTTNGTITFETGEISKTITVQVLGDTKDEFDETFFLNFTSVINATIVNNKVSATILDDDASPSITIGDRTITETDNGTTSITYTVNLSAPSGKPISVKYSTADGTAIALDDYTATNGIINFEKGETTKTITVQVLGDTIDEFDESFFVNLSDATNATIVNQIALGTIVDNDAPPSITIGDTTITEGHNGTQILNFTVSLNTASQKAISVKYDTANGTAIAGSDYTATSGILTFTPGETTKTVSVQVIGDRLDELHENFFVNLSQAINANIADAQAIGTIMDDDSSPTLTVATVPGQLWPPNHKMVQVKVQVNVSDDFDANPTVKLVSITSNEPDNGLGDGDTAGDIEIRSDGQIFLRAERSGNGNGRIYTLTYSATDSAGNVTVATTKVSVPKNQGK